jgi:hypothetical protein
VLRSRKLAVVAATVGAFGGCFGLASIPTASAQQCAVTVTVLGGQKLSFLVDVPPGTPVSALSLPVKLPVVGISESCAPATTPTTPTMPTTPTAPTTPTTPTTPSTTSTPTTSTPSSQGTTPSIAPPSAGGAKKQKPSVNHHTSPVPTVTVPSSKGQKPTTGSGSRTPKKSKPAPPPTRSGVPTAANPTFSFSLPGPAPIGVPNFFIDNFRIPPFLLPIYQAAGIEYDVPWQVLAAINEIETDYGRDLSVSSAGAVGWMQFLPATFKQYAVDANGDGVADPYNPVDAIFSAAKYLSAAGASKNLGNAIFAYNHASWYVQSVLLRAQLIGGMPQQLIGALTGLVEGDFPVAAPAKYADDAVEKLATQRVHGANAAIPVSSDPNSKGVSIFAKQGSPVIAVNDGKIVKIGQSKQLGRYIELQDATGNVYTYAQLGSVATQYPVPNPVHVTAAQIAKELKIGPTPAGQAPSAPATAGSQNQLPAPTTVKASSRAGSEKITLPTTSSTAAADAGAQPASVPSVPFVKERLFAHPSRPASYAAGGSQQMQSLAGQVSSFQNYFSSVLHLGKNQYTLKPLTVGSIVVAGTILGRLAAPAPQLASHVLFMIQPAGNKAPQIDPKPILDGWKLLEATAVYRAANKDPFLGTNAKNPTIGQVLLMSKEQLQQRVLADPHIQIYACGRRDIQSGVVDRRILATLAFLSGSGLDPSVSGLVCGASLTRSTGTDSAGATGSSMDISAVNSIPVLGHQGKGSITDQTIRRLLTLQGTFKPDQIISTMSYTGQSNTLALPDHANRVQVTYTPLFGQNKKLSAQIASALNPGQWVKLINRIGQISEPVVPIAPSKYAISTGRG